MQSPFCTELALENINHSYSSANDAWPHGSSEPVILHRNAAVFVTHLLLYSMLGLRAAAQVFRHAQSSAACALLANTTSSNYIQVIQLAYASPGQHSRFEELD